MLSDHPKSLASTGQSKKLQTGGCRCRSEATRERARPRQGRLSTACWPMALVLRPSHTSRQSGSTFCMTRSSQCCSSCSKRSIRWGGAASSLGTVSLSMQTRPRLMTRSTGGFYLMSGGCCTSTTRRSNKYCQMAALTCKRFRTRWTTSSGHRSLSIKAHPAGVRAASRFSARSGQGRTPGSRRGLDQQPGGQDTTMTLSLVGQTRRKGSAALSHNSTRVGNASSKSGCRSIWPPS
mmetsp:Transcript_48332/g.149291  ORF Transcript_48332/g.149291 Transcript_48332/m.149291 type:complete len:236 (+) Transcript_48332:466-1173(+)